ncbi:hypothetical protein OG216_38195 [Streptomycetaceae bacterium NBC_01309]
MSQPAGTQWQAVDSYLLPFSATVGPAVVDADIARCYTRTPAGAVFAAVHGSWRYQRTSDWGAAAQHLLAPGPGREAYLAQRAARSGPNAGPVPPASGDDSPQTIGFRVLEYSLDRARVDVLTQPFEGGVLTHNVWNVLWLEGDWRIEVPAGGNPPTPTPAGSADAFVEWDQTTMRPAGADPPGPSR